MATDNKKHITLINTIHVEEVSCNTINLYRIIENISPDIIFEELPPLFFDEYYKNHTRHNLETDTINQYLEAHRIEHIPVDIHDLPPRFWEENQYLMETIEKHSPQYRKLLDTNILYRAQYGFKYLNSEYNENMNSMLYKEIEETLKILNKERLNNAYKIWQDVIEKREIAILKNIYDYSKDHDFESGLLFIGAAHRAAIIAKIKNYEKLENNMIEWNYSNYENIY